MAKKRPNFITTQFKMTCAVCRSKFLYEKTGLEQIEDTLRKEHPGAKYYGKGWTKNYSKTWACQDCVSLGRAIRANPLEQVFGGFAGPFFAFWDRTRSCEYCGDSFVFTAGEQQYWYEEAKFFPDSVPVGCKNCRRPLKEHRTAQNKLREALETHDESDWTAWEVLSGHYRSLRCQEKTLETLRRAKNLCRETVEVERLKGMIAELQESELEPLPKRNYEFKNFRDYWP